jgi:predicted Zn-dependent protease
MKSLNTIRIAGFALGLLLILDVTIYLGCGTGLNIYNKSQDVQLGKQMQAQIAADSKDYPVLNNPKLTQYVQGIENTIVSSPNVTNKDFVYHITIINDDKTINAFTIPGGSIYVYTGLLKFVDNEATLAGVLAHETTHADHRHSTRQLTQQAGLQQLTAIALGNNNGALTNIVTNLGTNLTMLRFSRDDENEADKGSFDDLSKLPGQPWYPGALRYFMTKTLASGQEKNAGLTQLFLTHPPSQDRLNLINSYVSSAHLPEPTEAQLRTSQYQTYRAMVR